MSNYWYNYGHSAATVLTPAEESAAAKDPATIKMPPEAKSVAREVLGKLQATPVVSALDPTFLAKHGPLRRLVLVVYRLLIQVQFLLKLQFQFLLKLRFQFLLKGAVPVPAQSPVLVLAKAAAGAPLPVRAPTRSPHLLTFSEVIRFQSSLIHQSPHPLGERFWVMI